MTTRHVLTGLLALLISSGGATLAAQEMPFEKRTANTLTAAPGVPSPPASLNDLAWFAGRWTGSGLGGTCEETWSAPAGGAILGTFRLIRDGRAVFYEILTFTEHEGSLLLKLKHFNPDLTGWEEKNDTVSFRLLKATSDTFYFDGLTFRRDGADELEIFLALRDRKTGAVREERFAMTRAH
jgi:hypothetical protein